MRASEGKELRPFGDVLSVCLVCEQTGGAFAATVHTVVHPLIEAFIRYHGKAPVFVRARALLSINPAATTCDAHGNRFPCAYSSIHTFRAAGTSPLATK